MLGTSPDARGGIASVVAGYQDAALFERWDVRYLTTHVQAGAFRKLAVASKAWCSLFRMLVCGDVALIHIHMSSRASTWRKFMFVVLAVAFTTPFVVHMHGGNYVDFYNKECGRFGRSLIRWVLHRAAHVIVLSAGWQDQIRRIEPRARTLVIHNFVPLPTTAAMEHAMDSTEPASLLFLGRLTREKGAFDLVRAAGKLNFDFRLIMGGGGDPGPLYALADSLGIKDKVAFPGWISGNDKARALSEAEIFVLPSHFEGVPVAILEAMAWGVPIVATGVGGIPEVVGPAEGVLVLVGDVDALAAALNGLLANPSMRATMGKAARSRVAATYSREAVIPHIDQLWSSYGVRRAEFSPNNGKA